MLNQLINIPSRYVGLTVDGCLIDGLTAMSGIFLRQCGQYPGSNYLLTPLGDRSRTTTGDLIGWTKHSHRMLHWRSFPSRLQLQQG